MSAAPCLLLLTLLASTPALAGEEDPTAGWNAASDEQLAQSRGGFETANGLLVSFGVERLVSINGATVASSNVSIPDVTKLSPEQAQLANQALSAVTLVQNGAGNVFQPGAPAPALGALVIQNSASDQLIRSQTTISATVNSLSLLKSLNFEASLRSSLSSAVGSR